MLQFDEYKVKLNNLRPQLDELEKALNLDSTAQEVDFLEAESASDGFWDNLEKAQRCSSGSSSYGTRLRASKSARPSGTTDDPVRVGQRGRGRDSGSRSEEGFAKLEAEIEEAKLSTLLTGEYDGSNAILTFHAGAGGTEAQDWAQMALPHVHPLGGAPRLRVQDAGLPVGDEAGLKSATISIEGENAYGHLKSEHGVHRLVRVSPFDANARRQTSFAALEVMPEIPDDVEVDIRPEDVEMQVFRSSGAGGQHINKTSSAVRLIHKPTGIVVSCQTERSQFQNRDTCMRMLRSKLVELQMQAHARRSPTSRVYSSRSSGAARSVLTCLCPTSW